MNLLPPTVEAMKKSHRVKRYMAIGQVAIFGLLVAGFLMLNQRVDQQDIRRQQAESQLAEFDQRYGHMAQALDNIFTAQQQVALFYQINPASQFLAKYIGIIAQQAPTSTYIGRVRYLGQGMILAGHATDLPSVYHFIDNLAVYFSQVELGFITQAESGGFEYEIIIELPE